MTGLTVGIVIGLILGLTGAGGSLFAVPMLSYLLGLTMVEATGIALGAVSASAAFGVWQRKSVGIVWMPVLIILVTGALLAPLGRWFVGYVSSQLLLGCFSVVGVLVAWQMWRQASHEPADVGEVRAGGDAEGLLLRPQALLTNGYWPSPILLKSLLGGVITGLLSGLLGVGGGFVIVPVLTMLVGLTIKQAVVSSLLIISCVSLSGFAAHWWLHQGIALTTLLLVAAGGVLGMYLGARLSDRVAGPGLQKTFSVLLLMMLPLLWLRTM